MGLSNGFLPGAAGAAGGGTHGSTHRPGSVDPLGSLAGQSFAASSTPSAFQDGSVWIPSDGSDPLRGRIMKWHAWRDSGSGRWVSSPFTIEYGSDNTDGTYLELAAVGPSSEVGFVFDASGLITAIRAARANEGPTSKMFYLVLDGNVASPLYGPFSINKGSTFSIISLDLPVPAGSILGVRSSSTGDPCMVAVVVEAAWRK